MVSRSNLKYIVTAPYSSKGGVAAFVNNIKPYLENNKIFYRGSIFKGPFKILNWLFLVVLPVRFTFFLLLNRPSCVIINSSLSFAGILRDGILVFIAKTLRFKVLLIIHGFQEEDLRYKLLLRFGYYRADAIMVLSNKFINKLVEAGCPKPIHMFYNPVNAELLDLCTNKKYSSCPKNATNLLFIARVEKAKGIYICIDAFNIVRLKYPLVTLTIAGDGTELESAKRYVEEKKIANVFFRGFISGAEKLELLSHSDILIFPTFYKEGLPINVLEAMAAGMFVITRPVAGLVDLYNATEFGIVTASIEPQHFAEVVIDVLQSEQFYKSVRDKNSVFAKQNFHPAKISSGIEKIILTL